MAVGLSSISVSTFETAVLSTAVEQTTEQPVATVEVTAANIFLASGPWLLAQCTAGCGLTKTVKLSAEDETTVSEVATVQEDSAGSSSIGTGEFTTVGSLEGDDMVRVLAREAAE